MYTVCDNGPYDAPGRLPVRRHVGVARLSARNDALARSDGVDQHAAEDVAARARAACRASASSSRSLSKAAKKLGLDQVEVRKINAPAGKAPFGPALPNGKQAYVTSAFVKEALDKGRELFEWEAKKASLSGKRSRAPRRAASASRSARTPAARSASTACSSSSPTAASSSSRASATSARTRCSTCTAQAAEMLGVPWEQCDVVFGSTAKNLPWTCVSAGSQTAHAMTRAAHAAATDAIKKLQEIAAKAHGRQPGSLQGRRAASVSGPGGGMTFAQAAQKAIELGGKFDGHELPEDINAFTKTSATALAGQGLMARGQGRVSARRPDAVLRRRLRGSRSRHRDRRGDASSTTPRSATSAPSSTRAAWTASCSADRCSASATR